MLRLHQSSAFPGRTLRGADTVVATVLGCESGFSAVANLFARNMSTPPRDMITSSQNVYEVRPRKDHRGVDLISDALPLPGPLHRIALESFLIAEWQMIRP